MMRYFFASILIAVLASLSSGQITEPPAMPMEYKFEDSIQYRWLNKPVHEAKLLDSMEMLDTWVHGGGFGNMELTQERAHDGSTSLRLTSPTKGDKPGSVSGRPFGGASVTRNFERENWSDFNRLSFWVYPSLPGFKVISMCIILHNDGEIKVPDEYFRDGLNFVLLEPDKWNHVVWEIAHLSRDQVTGVEFQYRLQGNEPGATETVCFDFDQLELQRVDADHFEGWEVAPGEIAYSHSGYEIGLSKSALSTGLNVKEYELIFAESGAVVQKGTIESWTNYLGSFQRMDFSSWDEPGMYILKAGDVETRPFPIKKNVWRESVWKIINFFYTERCGTAIPGIHDICHQDWRVEHNGKEIVINGGWHDAGDLSQGLVNTSEAAYAMLSFAEALRDTDSVLSNRLIEEAEWGVDWILKTRFGDGSRCSWATMDFWTDGIFGTVDDVTTETRNNSFDNFLAAATEAMAYRVMRERDSERANECLKAAREDWQFALDRMRNLNLEVAAAGLQASIDLFKATQEQKYANKAFELAQVVIQCQEQSTPAWAGGFCGFFYTGPHKERLLHYSHRSHEQAPIVALTQLCELFPDHIDWIQWYACVVLYSEYQKLALETTQPYGMMPASIYALSESDRPAFREQVISGIQLSYSHYFRLFPVWFDFRGNHGTGLSQTRAMSSAAWLRRDRPSLSDRTLKESANVYLQWVVGRNPFAQSTIWGEGYNFAPQYTAMSGDLVGSFPVGIQTHFNRDEPYWPPANCYNYKEVWVHPASRWLGVVEDLLKPGPQSNTIRFIDTIRLGIDKNRRCTGSIEIEGDGLAEVRILAFNAKLENPVQKLDLATGQRQTVQWSGTVLDPKAPVIYVLIPNGDFSMRRELLTNEQIPRVIADIRSNSYRKR